MSLELFQKDCSGSHSHIIKDCVYNLNVDRNMRNWEKQFQPLLSVQIASDLKKSHISLALSTSLSTILLM